MSAQSKMRLSRPQNSPTRTAFRCFGWLACLLLLLIAGCGGSGTGGGSNSSGTVGGRVVVNFLWPQQTPETAQSGRAIPRRAKYLRVRVLRLPLLTDVAANATLTVNLGTPAQPVSYVVLQQTTHQRPDTNGAVQDSITFNDVPAGAVVLEATAWDGLPDSSTLMAVATSSVVSGSGTAPVVTMTLNSTVTALNLKDAGGAPVTNLVLQSLQVGESKSFTVEAVSNTGALILLDPAEIQFNTPTGVGVQKAATGLGITLSGLSRSSTVQPVNVTLLSDTTGAVKPGSVSVIVRTRITFDNLKAGIENLGSDPNLTSISGRSVGDRLSFTLNTNNGLGGTQPTVNFAVTKTDLKLNPVAITAADYLLLQDDGTAVLPATLSGTNVTFVPRAQGMFTIIATSADVPANVHTLTITVDKSGLQIQGATNVLQGDTTKLTALLNRASAAGATYTVNGTPLNNTGPATATFTAPVDNPAGGTFLVTATTTDGTQSATLTIIVPPRTLTITPTILTRKVQQFQLQTTGIIAPPKLTWLVQSGPGTIDPNTGIYDLGSYIVDPANLTVLDQNSRGIVLSVSFTINGTTITTTQNVRVPTSQVGGKVN